MKTFHSKDISNKENIHPNIVLASTEQPKQEVSRSFPKVSCFGISHDDSNHKDWRKRIFSFSEREKALNNKLVRMLKRGKGSPQKQDKVLTEAASNHKQSQKLGNTLLRYLYQRSHSHMNVTFTEDTMSQLLQELHRTAEEIVGSEIQIKNAVNPEDIILGVVDALKEYKDSKRSKLGHVAEQSANRSAN